MEDQTGLDEAIAAAGSQTALARLLDMKSPSISGWIYRKQIPAERVLQVEAATGIPRQRLRPDIYPPDEKVAKRPSRNGAARA